MFSEVSLLTLSFSREREERDRERLERERTERTELMEETQKEQKNDLEQTKTLMWNQLNPDSWGK